MKRNDRIRRRRATAAPEITLTPLIDTALTLLIIFMVTTPMLNNNIKVELPQGKAQEEKMAAQDLIVFVDKEGQIYLNDQKMQSLDALMTGLQKQVGTQKERTVFVKADKQVHYGKVIELVDHIKVVGGITYVALATKRA